MPEWGGDARYERLVREHGTSLLHLALLLTRNRQDAEDVVQDALIAVAAKWPMPQSLAYLRRAVSNRAIDVIRKRHDVLVDEVPDAAVVDSGYFRFEDDERFFALVNTVPERQREVLILRYYADLDDRSIARTLGVTPETVRSQAHRGLAKLRESERLIVGSTSTDEAAAKGGER